MDVFDLMHLLCLTVALVATVMHMNTLYYKTTPRFEIGAWWVMGVGLFGDWSWQVYWIVTGVPYYLSPEHAFTSLGVTALIVLNTQPDWRPFLADRRKVFTPVDETCDRRCAHLLGLRKPR